MRSWWLYFTEGKTGNWTAWATKTPVQNPTGRRLMTHPGEVHFAIGPTVEEARDLLESELPA